MSPKAQQIAIAKACGKNVFGWRFFWRKHDSKEWIESPTYHDEALAKEWAEKESRWGSEIGKIEEFEAPAMCPNYLNDQNAIHAAFLSLSWEKQCEYTAMLPVVCGSNQPNHYCNATAAKRCEAFLKTVGKWQPDALLSQRSKGEAG